MSRHIDKAELISKLQTLDGLTVDERSSLIGLLREHKKYGLVWEDKPEDVEERLRDELPVLREVKDKAILSDAPDAPNHILIEGDNLEALTALSYTHEGKIDVIYIDPPYNTGNKDFVYNDSFVDTEDSYRHSKWLSFMNKRLKIAKKLLSDKGVIFISIDDNEQANLKILCDSIWGVDKYVTSIPRLTKMQRSAQEKHMDISHDYVLCYAKTEDFVHIIDREIDEAKVKKDSIGSYIENDTKAILADKSKGYSIGGDYDFEYNGKIYQPVDKNGVRNRWLWTRERMQAAADLGILVETQSSLRMQLYLDKKFDDKTNTMIPKDSRLIFHTSDFVTDSKVSNAKGSTELKEIGSDLFAKFNNPKPLHLLTSLCKLQGDSSSTILDFFAGSGTTLHATMQLNAEDGGHRQCILVTNNENNICEEVTYERNKRVINGYTTPKGVEVAGLKANTLRYYKTDYISRDRTQKNMRDLVAAATDLLCIKEDLYEEQNTFGRFKLKPHLARYFNNGKKQMLIIYREELIDEIAEEIMNLDFGKKRLKIYVFSPGRYAFNDNFREVEDKVELVALPAAIYDAYQKVLPKRKEKLFGEEKEVSAAPISQDLFAEQEEGGES